MCPGWLHRLPGRAARPLPSLGVHVAKGHLPFPGFTAAPVLLHGTCTHLTSITLWLRCHHRHVLLDSDQNRGHDGPVDTVMGNADPLPDSGPGQGGCPQPRFPIPSFPSSSCRLLLGSQSISKLSCHHEIWALQPHNRHLLLLSGQHPLFLRGIVPLTSVT